MEVTLKVSSGPAAGRTIAVRTGQVVRIGSGAAAELSVPDDPEMAALHLALTCDSRNCHLRVLEDADSAEVNGETVLRAVLREGDRVRAGRTTFSIEPAGGVAASAAAGAAAAPTAPAPSAAAASTPAAVAGPDDTTVPGAVAVSPPVPPQVDAPPQPAPAPPAPGAGSPAPATITPPVPPAAAPAPSAPAADAAAKPAETGGPSNGVECCKELSLGDEARELAREDQTPDELLDQLIAKGHFTDAIRLLAFRLPKRRAVDWAIRCLMGVSAGSLPSKEATALVSAQQWVADPGDENRRATQAAAESAEFSGAASWIAMAAFWSGGSIAPPGQADVPPAEGLTAQAISAALTLAAVHGDPAKAPERYRSFLESGLKERQAVATG